MGWLAVIAACALLAVDGGSAEPRPVFVCESVRGHAKQTIASGLKQFSLARLLHNRSRLLSVYRGGRDQARGADRDNNGNISDKEFLQSLLFFADSDVRDGRVTQAEFVDGYRSEYGLPAEVVVVMFDLLDDLNQDVPDTSSRDQEPFRDTRHNTFFDIFSQMGSGNNVFRNTARNKGDGLLTQRDVSYQKFAGSGRNSVDDYRKALLTWVAEAANRLYTINYQPHIPGNPWDREFDYERWFHNVDRNNDSLVSLAELQNEFRRYSYDGRVSRSRWTERSMEVYGDREWLANTVFDYWDKNRDMRLDTTDIALLLREADINRDMFVTTIEFHRLMEKYNKRARRRLATPVRPVMYDCPSPWWQSFGCRPRVDATRVAMDMDDNFDGWITHGELRKRLSYYDRNGDGWASRFEVMTLESLRYGVRGPVASVMFDIYDRNGDGRYDYADLQFMLTDGRVLCFCDARQAVLDLVRLAEMFRFTPQAQGPVGSLRNAMRWHMSREWAWRQYMRSTWHAIWGRGGRGGCREGDCTGKDWRGGGWYSPFDWRQRNRVPENFLQWSYLQNVPRTLFIPGGPGGGMGPPRGAMWWDMDWWNGLAAHPPGHGVGSGDAGRTDKADDRDDGFRLPPTPSAVPSGQFPTSQFPPGQDSFPSGQFPSGQFPSGQFPPGKDGFPSGQFPSGQFPPGQDSFPSGQFPPGQDSFPSGQFPSGQFPPGQDSFPSGQFPPGKDRFPSGQFPSGQDGFPSGPGFPPGAGSFPQSHFPFPSGTGFPSSSKHSPSGVTGKFPPVPRGQPSGADSFPGQSGSFPPGSGDGPSQSEQFPAGTGQFPPGGFSPDRFQPGQFPSGQFFPGNFPSGPSSFPPQTGSFPSGSDDSGGGQAPSPGSRLLPGSDGSARGFPFGSFPPSSGGDPSSGDSFPTGGFPPSWMNPSGQGSFWNDLPGSEDNDTVGTGPWGGPSGKFLEGLNRQGGSFPWWSQPRADTNNESGDVTNSRQRDNTHWSWSRKNGAQTADLFDAQNRQVDPTAHSFTDSHGVTDRDTTTSTQPDQGALDAVQADNTEGSAASGDGGVNGKKNGKLLGGRPLLGSPRLPPGALRGGRSRRNAADSSKAHTTASTPIQAPPSAGETPADNFPSDSVSTSPSGSDSTKTTKTTEDKDSETRGADNNLDTIGRQSSPAFRTLNDWMNYGRDWSCEGDNPWTNRADGLRWYRPDGWNNRAQRWPGLPDQSVQTGAWPRAPERPQGWGGGHWGANSQPGGYAMRGTGLDPATDVHGRPPYTAYGAGQQSPPFWSPMADNSGHSLYRPQWWRGYNDNSRVWAAGTWQTPTLGSSSFPGQLGHFSGHPSYTNPLVWPDRPRFFKRSVTAQDAPWRHEAGAHSVSKRSPDTSKPDTSSMMDGFAGYMPGWGNMWNYPWWNNWRHYPMWNNYRSYYPFSYSRNEKHSASKRSTDTATTPDTANMMGGYGGYMPGWGNMWNYPWWNNWRYYPMWSSYWSYYPFSYSQNTSPDEKHTASRRSTEPDTSNMMGGYGGYMPGWGNMWNYPWWNNWRYYPMWNNYWSYYPFSYSQDGSSYDKHTVSKRSTDTTEPDTSSMMGGYGGYMPGWGNMWNYPWWSNSRYYPMWNNYWSYYPFSYSRNEKHSASKRSTDADTAPDTANMMGGYGGHMPGWGNMWSRNWPWWNNWRYYPMWNNYWSYYPFSYSQSGSPDLKHPVSKRSIDTSKPDTANMMGGYGGYMPGWGNMWSYPWWRNWRYYPMWNNYWPFHQFSYSQDGSGDDKHTVSKRSTDTTEPDTSSMMGGYGGYMPGWGNMWSGNWPWWSNSRYYPMWNNYRSYYPFSYSWNEKLSASKRSTDAATAPDTANMMGGHGGYMPGLGNMWSYPWWNNWRYYPMWNNYWSYYPFSYSQDGSSDDKHTVSKRSTDTTEPDTSSMMGGYGGYMPGWGNMWSGNWPWWSNWRYYPMWNNYWSYYPFSYSQNSSPNLKQTVSKRSTDTSEPDTANMMGGLGGYMPVWGNMWSYPWWSYSRHYPMWYYYYMPGWGNMWSYPWWNNWRYYPMWNNYWSYYPFSYSQDGSSDDKHTVSKRSTDTTEVDTSNMMGGYGGYMPGWGNMWNYLWWNNWRYYPMWNNYWSYYPFSYSQNSSPDPKHPVSKRSTDTSKPDTANMMGGYGSYMPGWRNMWGRYWPWLSYHGQLYPFQFSQQDPEPAAGKPIVMTKRSTSAADKEGPQYSSMVGQSADWGPLRKTPYSRALGRWQPYSSAWNWPWHSSNMPQHSYKMWNTWNYGPWWNYWYRSASEGYHMSLENNFNRFWDGRGGPWEGSIAFSTAQVTSDGHRESDRHTLTKRSAGSEEKQEDLPDAVPKASTFRMMGSFWPQWSSNWNSYWAGWNRWGDYRWMWSVWPFSYSKDGPSGGKHPVFKRSPGDPDTPVSRLMGSHPYWWNMWSYPWWSNWRNYPMRNNYWSYYPFSYSQDGSSDDKHTVSKRSTDTTEPDTSSMMGGYGGYMPGWGNMWSGNWPWWSNSRYYPMWNNYRSYYPFSYSRNEKHSASKRSTDTATAPDTANMMGGYGGYMPGFGHMWNYPWKNNWRYYPMWNNYWSYYPFSYSRDEKHSASKRSTDTVTEPDTANMMGGYGGYMPGWGNMWSYPWWSNRRYFAMWNNYWSYYPFSYSQNSSPDWMHSVLKRSTDTSSTPDTSNMMGGYGGYMPEWGNMWSRNWPWWSNWRYYPMWSKYWSYYPYSYSRNGSPNEKHTASRRSTEPDTSSMMGSYGGYMPGWRNMWSYPWWSNWRHYPMWNNYWSYYPFSYSRNEKHSASKRSTDTATTPDTANMMGGYDGYMPGWGNMWSYPWWSNWRYYPMWNNYWSYYPFSYSRNGPPDPKHPVSKRSTDISEPDAASMMGSYGGYMPGWRYMWNYPWWNNWRDYPMWNNYWSYYPFSYSQDGSSDDKHTVSKRSTDTTEPDTSSMMGGYGGHMPGWGNMWSYPWWNNWRYYPMWNNYWSYYPFSYSQNEKHSASKRSTDAATAPDTASMMGGYGGYMPGWGNMWSYPWWSSWRYYPMWNNYWSYYPFSYSRNEKHSASKRSTDAATAPDTSSMMGGYGGYMPGWGNKWNYPWWDNWRYYPMWSSYWSYYPFSYSQNTSPDEKHTASRRSTEPDTSNMMGGYGGYMPGWGNMWSYPWWNNWRYYPMWNNYWSYYPFSYSQDGSSDDKHTVSKRSTDTTEFDTSNMMGGYGGYMPGWGNTWSYPWWSNWRYYPMWNNYWSYYPFSYFQKSSPTEKQSLFKRSTDSTEHNSSNMMGGNGGYMPGWGNMWSYPWWNSWRYYPMWNNYWSYYPFSYSQDGSSDDKHTVSKRSTDTTEPDTSNMMGGYGGYMPGWGNMWSRNWPWWSNWRYYPMWNNYRSYYPFSYSRNEKHSASKRSTGTATTPDTANMMGGYNGYMPGWGNMWSYPWWSNWRYFPMWSDYWSAYPFSYSQNSSPVRMHSISKRSTDASAPDTSSMMGGYGGYMPGWGNMWNYPWWNNWRDYPMWNNYWSSYPLSYSQDGSSDDKHTVSKRSTDTTEPDTSSMMGGYGGYMPGWGNMWSYPWWNNWRYYPMWNNYWSYYPFSYSQDEKHSASKRSTDTTTAPDTVNMMGGYGGYMPGWGNMWNYLWWNNWRYYPMWNNYWSYYPFSYSQDGSSDDEHTVSKRSTDTTESDTSSMMGGYGGYMPGWGNMWSYPWWSSWRNYPMWNNYWSYYPFSYSQSSSPNPKHSVSKRSTDTSEPDTSSMMGGYGGYMPGWRNMWDYPWWNNWRYYPMWNNYWSYYPFSYIRKGLPNEKQSLFKRSTNRSKPDTANMMGGYGGYMPGWGHMWSYPWWSNWRYYPMWSSYRSYYPFSYSRNTSPKVKHTASRRSTEPDTSNMMGGYGGYMPGWRNMWSYPWWNNWRDYPMWNSYWYYYPFSYSQDGSSDDKHTVSKRSIDSTEPDTSNMMGGYGGYMPGWGNMWSRNWPWWSNWRYYPMWSKYWSYYPYSYSRNGSPNEKHTASRRSTEPDTSNMMGGNGGYMPGWRNMWSYPWWSNWRHYPMWNNYWSYYPFSYSQDGSSDDKHTVSKRSIDSTEPDTSNMMRGYMPGWQEMWTRNWPWWSRWSQYTMWTGRGDNSFWPFAYSQEEQKRSDAELSRVRRQKRDVDTDGEQHNIAGQDNETEPPTSKQMSGSPFSPFSDSANSYWRPLQNNGYIGQLGWFGRGRNGYSGYDWPWMGGAWRDNLPWNSGTLGNYGASQWNYDRPRNYNGPWNGDLWSDPGPWSDSGSGMWPFYTTRAWTPYSSSSSNSPWSRYRPWGGDWTGRGGLPAWSGLGSFVPSSFPQPTEAPDAGPAFAWQKQSDVTEDPEKGGDGAQISPDSDSARRSRRSGGMYPVNGVHLRDRRYVPGRQNMLWGGQYGSYKGWPDGELSMLRRSRYWPRWMTGDMYSNMGNSFFSYMGNSYYPGWRDVNDRLWYRHTAPLMYMQLSQAADRDYEIRHGQKGSEAGQQDEGGSSVNDADTSRAKRSTGRLASEAWEEGSQFSQMINARRRVGMPWTRRRQIFWRMYPGRSSWSARKPWNGDSSWNSFHPDWSFSRSSDAQGRRTKRSSQPLTEAAEPEVTNGPKPQVSAQMLGYRPFGWHPMYITGNKWNVHSFGNSWQQLAGGWNGWTGGQTRNSWTTGHSFTFPSFPFAFSKTGQGAGSKPSGNVDNNSRTLLKRSSDSARRQAEKTREPIVSPAMSSFGSFRPDLAPFSRPFWEAGRLHMSNSPGWMGGQQMFPGTRPGWMDWNSHPFMWSSWQNGRPAFSSWAFESPMWGMGGVNNLNINNGNFEERVDESLLDPLSSFYFSKTDDSPKDPAVERAEKSTGDESEEKRGEVSGKDHSRPKRAASSLAALLSRHKRAIGLHFPQKEDQTQDQSPGAVRRKQLKRFSAAAVARLETRFNKRSADTVEGDSGSAQTDTKPAPEPSVARHSVPPVGPRNPKLGQAVNRPQFPHEQHSRGQHPPNGQNLPPRQWGSAGGQSPSQSTSITSRGPGQVTSPADIHTRFPTAHPSTGPEVSPGTGRGQPDDRSWNVVSGNGVPGWQQTPEWYGSGSPPSVGADGKPHTAGRDQSAGQYTDQSGGEYGSGQDSDTDSASGTLDSRLSDYNYFDQYTQTWNRFYNPAGFNGSFAGFVRNMTQSNRWPWLELWAYGPNFWGDTDNMFLYGGPPFTGPAGMGPDGNMWEAGDRRFGGWGDGLTGPGFEFPTTDWWAFGDAAPGPQGDIWWKGFGGMPFTGAAASPSVWSDDCDRTRGWAPTSPGDWQGPWNTQQWWSPAWYFRPGYGALGGSGPSDFSFGQWSPLSPNRMAPGGFRDQWRGSDAPGSAGRSPPDGRGWQDQSLGVFTPWQGRPQYAGSLADTLGRIPVHFPFSSRHYYPRGYVKTASPWRLYGYVGDSVRAGFGGGQLAGPSRRWLYGGEDPWTADRAGWNRGVSHGPGQEHFGSLQWPDSFRYPQAYPGPRQIVSGGSGPPGRQLFAGGHWGSYPETASYSPFSRYFRRQIAPDSSDAPGIQGVPPQGVSFATGDDPNFSYQSDDLSAPGSLPINGVPQSNQGFNGRADLKFAGDHIPPATFVEDGGNGCEERPGPDSMVPWYWRNYFRGREGSDSPQAAQAPPADAPVVE